MKRIESLKPNQIFVFGSNANGNHAGGAARQALELFGAIMGQAEGLQGQSYGIVTLDKDMQKVSLDYIKEQLIKLNAFAKRNPDKVFLMTLIGCGIAGFSIEEIKSEVERIDWERNVDIPDEFRVVQSYKAFDKDMKCRDYQYEVGGEYEEESAKICESGFHACTNPFDTLNYYPLINDNGQMTRFASVEQSGMVDNTESDKTCSSRVKIKAELGFPGFVRACVEWVKEITSPATIKTSKLSDNGKYCAQIGSSGNSAQIDSTGEDSVICCAGCNSAVKAKKGSWITLAEWKLDDEKGRFVPVCVKTEYVDGQRIKEDTWYELINGVFVEQ